MAVLVLKVLSNLCPVIALIDEVVGNASFVERTNASVKRRCFETKGWKVQIRERRFYGNFMEIVRRICFEDE